MMKSFVIVCVFLFVASSIAFKAIDSENKGFFEGRSGQVILDIDRKVDEEAFLFSSSDLGSSQVLKVTHAELTRLFAEVLGVSSYFPQSKLAPVIPTGSLFEKPRVGALFYLPGFLPDGLEDNTSLLSAMLHKNPSLKFKRSKNLPYTSPFSEYTSLLTGTTTSSHGVVGKSFMAGNGKLIECGSRKPTLTDLLLASHGEESFVLTASGDATMSKLGGMSDVSDVSMYSSSVLSVNWESDMPSPSSPEFATDFVWKIDDELTISFKLSEKTMSVNSEVFELLDADNNNDDVLKSFARELCLLAQLSEVLASRLPSRAPAFLTFAFTSLSSSSSSWKSSSLSRSRALTLASRCISSVIDSLDRLTEHRSFGSVVMTPTTPNLSTEYSDVLMGHLDKILLNPLSFSEMLPQIYVRSAANVREACSSIDSSTNFPYRIHCFIARSPFVGYSMTSSFLLAASTNDTNSSSSATSSSSGTVANYTKSEVERYQIVLWLSVVLILLVIAGSFSIAFMHIDRDSIIYRLTVQKEKKL